VRYAWKFALIALVALVLTGIPEGGGDNLLNLILTALTIVFFTAIALVGYRLFRQFRPELEGLPERNRAILYGSVGLAFLTFCATSRLFGVGGAGVIVWLALLAACSYGAYWVWLRYRAYD
jgi:hypothetical protein